MKKPTLEQYKRELKRRVRAMGRFNRFLLKVYYAPLLGLLRRSASSKYKILYRLNLWRYKHTPGYLFFDIKASLRNLLVKWLASTIAMFMRWFDSYRSLSLFYDGRCDGCGCKVRIPFIVSFGDFVFEERQDRVWHDMANINICPACLHLFTFSGIWKTPKGMAHHERYSEKKYAEFKKTVVSPGKEGDYGNYGT